MDFDLYNKIIIFAHKMRNKDMTWQLKIKYKLLFKIWAKIFLKPTFTFRQMVILSLHATKRVIIVGKYHLKVVYGICHVFFSPIFSYNTSLLKCLIFHKCDVTWYYNYNHEMKKLTLTIPLFIWLLVSKPTSITLLLKFKKWQKFHDYQNFFNIRNKLL